MNEESKNNKGPMAPRAIFIKYNRIYNIYIYIIHEGTNRRERESEK